jgi:predicted DNA-binding protein
MSTITVKLTPSLYRQLEKLSSRLKKRKSVVVRLAIEELLRQTDLKSKFSAYDLLAKYVGSVRGLDSRISEDSKDLEGYGFSS